MSSLKAAWERLCPTPPPGWKEPRARAAASQAQPGSSAEGQGAGGCRHGSTAATSPAAATGCELGPAQGADAVQSQATSNDTRERFQPCPMPG